MDVQPDGAASRCKVLYPALRVAPRKSDVNRLRPAVSLVGTSPAIESVKTVARLVAPRLCTVMILGETGTGKEMVARFIHAHSDRSEAPFIPVDCSALADNLFESQMFGHLRGAFTGAVNDSLGFVLRRERRYAVSR